MLGFCAFSSFCFSALKIRYALRARFGCGRAPPDPSTAGVAWLESITGWTGFFFAGVAFGSGAGLRFRGVPPSASARPGTAAGTSVASSSEEPPSTSIGLASPSPSSSFDPDAAGPSAAGSSRLCSCAAHAASSSAPPAGARLGLKSQCHLPTARPVPRAGLARASSPWRRSPPASRASSAPATVASCSWTCPPATPAPSGRASSRRTAPAPSPGSLRYHAPNASCAARGTSGGSIPPFGPPPSPSPRPPSPVHPRPPPSSSSSSFDPGGRSAGKKGRG